MSSIVVLAKAPVPGRVKTRLCPPYTLEEAALVGEAALRDTLAAATGSSASVRVLALDGVRGPWIPDGWTVVAQPGGDLNDRLAAAFDATPLPALLIGMDTPQLCARELDRALQALHDPTTDAVLGPALDGGYWAIGFRRAVTGAFRGVPMSSSQTCAVQHARLLALGLRVQILPAMRDVDDHADAVAVARLAPSTRLAQAVHRLEAASS
jgi:rSAM/selenodomain-associated transferase 1